MSSASRSSRSCHSGARHVCYCHTPMRYLWDMYDDYYRTAGFGGRVSMRLFRDFLRKEDLKSADDDLTDKWTEPAKAGVGMKDVDAFVAMFRQVPKARQDECIHRALNLIPDENVMLLAGVYQAAWARLRDSSDRAGVRSDPSSVG